MTHEDDLRTLAAGDYPEEAAAEMLIRGFHGQFAAPGNPWIERGTNGRPWINFRSIPEHIDRYSGGERKFLMLAASLGDAAPVELGEILPGMDRHMLDLVLAAFAHAAGSHEHSSVLQNADGTTSFTRLPPLHPWPPEHRHWPD